MKVRRADCRQRPVDLRRVLKELPQLGPGLPDSPRRRVRHFRAIEKRSRLVVVGRPEQASRVGGDCHSALCVDGGNGLRCGQPPIDRPGDAGGDHVKSRRGQLLRGNDQRVLLRSVEPRAVPRQPRGEQLVVIGHDDDVQPATPGLAAKLPRWDTAVADEGVHVEVCGEHELIAHARRVPDGHAIEHRAGDYRAANQQQSDQACTGHAPSAPIIRTDNRVASSM